MDSAKRDSSIDHPYVYIGFRVTPDEDAQLRQSVKESGTSISHYVRKALALTEEVRKPGRKPKDHQKVEA